MWTDHLAPLRAMGLGDALLERAHATFLQHPTWPALDAGTPGARLRRLTDLRRDSVRVHDGHDDVQARVLPRLQRALSDDETPLAVGDWVFCTADRDGQAWVLARVPPLNHLVRRDAEGRRHALVSNVDTALLVMGLDDDFNLRRLERYLTIAHGAELPAVVVLTKADMAERRPGAVDEALARVRRRLPDAQPVVAVDGTTAGAAQALAHWARPGHTLVLMGSSGAGKSTLTNTLAGQALQDTGGVRAHDSRGKHTTTSRSLFRLPGGACVIDTPGLRALRSDLDADQVAASFDDIQRLAAQCRFRNCQHASEPGCAVRDGVDADRLRNHDKLLREARRDQLTVLERQQMLAQWKARGRAGAARARAKRGEG